MSTPWALFIGPAVCLALLGVGALAGYVTGRDQGFKQGFGEAARGITTAARAEARARTHRPAQHRREDITGTIIASRTH